MCRRFSPTAVRCEGCIFVILALPASISVTYALFNHFVLFSSPPPHFSTSTEEEDDAGYLDVAVSEVKHPPPQLSPMPEGLTSHQVHQRAFCHKLVHVLNVTSLWLLCFQLRLLIVFIVSAVFTSHSILFILFRKGLRFVSGTIVAFMSNKSSDSCSLLQTLFKQTFLSFSVFLLWQTYYHSSIHQTVPCLTESIHILLPNHIFFALDLLTGLLCAQVVRRHILGSIIQSERSYLESLRRILQVSCLVQLSSSATCNIIKI